MDGIDVAMVETDGERVTPGRGGTYPYAADLRKELLAVAADAEQAEHAPLVELEDAVTKAHGDAIAAFLAENSIAPSSIDLIGLHGQTIYHRPEKRFTRQLGHGAAIASPAILKNCAGWA